MSSTSGWGQPHWTRVDSSPAIRFPVPRPRAVESIGMDSSPRGLASRLSPRPLRSRAQKPMIEWTGRRQPRLPPGGYAATSRLRNRTGETRQRESLPLPVPLRAKGGTRAFRSGERQCDG